MKVVVSGIGYVGLSIAILLSQKNEVIAVDIIEEKVNLINNKKSPIKDKEIEEFLKTKKLNLIATLDALNSYKNADIIIIATPTNYCEKTKCFDTSSIENVIDSILSVNKKATIIIKSTIPVGYTRSLIKKKSYNNILFSPEFLREGKALYDNLNPTRIIVGVESKTTNLIKKTNTFINLLKESSTKNDVTSIITGLEEAEAIKLFANTYLALRVSYFNELDTYAEMKQLNTKEIINGVCLDPRIGDFYNNPSFGYGGYCLPKDIKQLNANYEHVPNNLIKSVIASNKTRKDFIAKMITEKIKNTNIKKPTIGIYRLIMKSNSDNFRNSSTQDIIKRLNKEKYKIIIYEPTLKEKKFCGNNIIDNFTLFKKISTIIVANRYDSSLDDVKNKVFTRDLFTRD